MRASSVPVQAIDDAEKVSLDFQGPAFLAPGPENHLLSGLADGRVALFEASEENEREERGAAEPELEIAGVAPGRPFGVARGLGEVVIAAAGDAGLVAAVEGRILPLVSEAQGRPIRHAADAAVSFARGIVYFTDASDRYTPAQSWAEFVEHGANGRLLAYDSNRRTTQVLVDGLYFPLGIALAADESFVLVCEMTSYRVLKHWLTGKHAGKTEVFVDGLPGYPAEIGADPRGGFWLSLYAPRLDRMDRLASSPWLRALWFKLPRALQPAPAKRTWILGLDADGAITRDLRDDGADAYAPVIGVLEREGALYLGSPTQKGILRIELDRIVAPSGGTP